MVHIQGQRMPTMVHFLPHQMYSDTIVQGILRKQSTLVSTCLFIRQGYASLQ